MTTIRIYEGDCINASSQHSHTDEANIYMVQYETGKAASDQLAISPRRKRKAVKTVGTEKQNQSPN